MMKGIDCNEKMPFCFMQEEKAWICLAFQMYDKYKNGVSGVLCIIISIVMLFSMVKVMKSDNAGDCHEKVFFPIVLQISVYAMVGGTFSLAFDVEVSNLSLPVNDYILVMTYNRLMFVHL